MGEIKNVVWGSKVKLATTQKKVIENWKDYDQGELLTIYYKIMRISQTVVTLKIRKKCWI